MVFMLITCLFNIVLGGQELRIPLQPTTPFREEQIYRSASWTCSVLWPQCPWLPQPVLIGWREGWDLTPPKLRVTEHRLTSDVEAERHGVQRVGEAPTSQCQQSCGGVDTVSGQRNLVRREVCSLHAAKKWKHMADRVCSLWERSRAYSETGTRSLLTTLLSCFH